MGAESRPDRDDKLNGGRFTRPDIFSFENLERQPLRPGTPPSFAWNQRALLLRQRRINVQHERIDVGTKLGNNERYAMYHEPADEVDIPRQPVELGNRDRAFAPPLRKLAGLRDRAWLAA